MTGAGTPSRCRGSASTMDTTTGTRRIWPTTGAWRSRASSGDLSVPVAQAGEETTASLPGMLAAGPDTWLTVRAVLARDEPWAPAGHEIAWTQAPLPAAAPRTAAPGSTSGSPVRTDDDGLVRLGAGRFDPRTGTLVRLGELAVAGPQLDLWRAPTDAVRAPAGERHGVRWARITSPDGTGLHIGGRPSVELTVRRWISADLAAARHPYELRPSGAVHINVGPRAERSRLGFLRSRRAAAVPAGRRPGVHVHRRNRCRPAGVGPGRARSTGADAGYPTLVSR